MEIKHKHLSVENKIEELPALTAMLEQLADEWDLNPGLAMNLNLVIEEAITNVVFYAYDDKLPHLIDIDFELDGNELVIVISDDGTPFDPTKKTDPDISLSVDDRQVGGLGIFLIRKIMDKVSYRRENKKNILTLVKTL
ncbi:MAG: ATP-binding protein [Prolixibacteraceae bacterium]|nr:ATP-binding protein [Prolixibacteraceae bacterium]